MSSHLADGFLESILIEFIPFLPRKDFHCIDWLSKDITVQLVKVLLGDVLSNTWEGLLQSVDSDDKWKYYLTLLRNYLWPEAPCEKTLLNSHIKRNGQSTTSLDEIKPMEQQQTLIQG